MVEVIHSHAIVVVVIIALLVLHMKAIPPVIRIDVTHSWM